MKAKESNKFKALGMIDEVENRFNCSKVRFKTYRNTLGFSNVVHRITTIIGRKRKKSTKKCE